jgi:hypothetical protein
MALAIRCPAGAIGSCAPNDVRRMPDHRYDAMVAQIARILLRVGSSGTQKNRHDSVLAVKLRQAAAPTRSECASLAFAALLGQGGRSGRMASG